MAITQVSNSLVKQDLTISGGSVDNTVIGSGTPAAGTFTTIAGTLASTVTGTTAAASDNSTKIATTAYVTTALANLVDSAPGTLNTLNELAAALGDDASFSTTVTNSIAAKLPLAGGTMSGALNMGSQNITNAGTLNGITTTQSVSGTRWGVLPEIAGNGVMEIGRYVDFHATSGDTSDYGARFDFDGSKMILTSNFEGAGTIRGTRLGGNVASNSNYAINTLQNGSMTHAGYFQANGDDIGIEINATAGSYSSNVLYVRQSSLATGGNLARFANSAGDKVVITTAGDVGIGSAPSTGYGNLQVRNGFGYINEDGSNTKQMYLRTNYDTGNPAIQVATAHDLLFATSNTTRMTIDSSGHAEFYNDFKHNPQSANGHRYMILNRTSGMDGHIVFRQSGTNQWQQRTDANHNLRFYSYQNTAGYQFSLLSSGGIAFGTDTAQDNALDDYEEGYHDLSDSASGYGFSGAGGGGYFGLSTNSNSYAYTKVGRLVTCTGYIGVLSDPGVTGSLRFSLPYPCAYLIDDSEYSMSTLRITNNGSDLRDYQTHAFVFSGSYAYLHRVHLNGGTAAYIDHGDVDSSFQICFSLQYYAAS